MAGAVIRANRSEVSDRFPMLGFTIRTGSRPYFEAVVTTDPGLLSPERRAERTPQTFWSSRALGPLPAERGEAVFIIPDPVIRRFAGAGQLFYAVATFADRTRTDPQVTRVEGRAAPFVTLSPGYTGRRLRPQVGGRGEGVRWNGAGSRYAEDEPASLEWAGDAAQPGVEPAPNGGSNGGNGGNGVADVAYDDGYGQALWKETRRSVPVVGRGSSVGGESFDLEWPDVPMVAEEVTIPGWLAAAAMVIGWRDRRPVEAVRLLQALDPSAAVAGPASAAHIAGLAEALGLEPEALQSPTVQRLRELVANRGPQWLGVAGPAPRFVVVTGLYGDGTPAGTRIRISDPSIEALGTNEPIAVTSDGTGTKYVLTFQQLLDAFGALAPGAGLQAIHVTEADMQGRVPLVTSQARALSRSAGRNGPGGTHLARGQAVPAVVPIVSTIIGASMTRIMNNEGDISWELDQLQGLKHPNDDASRAGTANYRTIVTPVSGWPKIAGGIHEIEALTDYIYADFEIEWQYNGHSLGNVAIRNTHNNDAVGHGLAVKATINNDATIYEGDLAALRVSFNYQFSRTIGANAVAIRNFTLYADGTIHDESRWTQAPDGWWGATEQRLGRAHAGGAILAEIAGPIAETTLKWFKDSLEDDITVTLPELKGWKHVDDNPSNRRTGQDRVKTVTVVGPQMGIDYLVTESTIRCDLLLTWSWDGSSLGNIKVRPTNPNDPPGGGLDIKGEVYDSNETKTGADGARCAAVRLVFTYTFKYEFDSVEYRNFDVLLYGDGTHDVIRHD